MGTNEKELLEGICSDVKTKGRISEKSKARLSKIFGERYQKASKVVQEGRVMKYVFKPSEKVVWIVQGREGKYQVMPSVGFCSCKDFYYKLEEGRGHVCYHLVAQRLAEALNVFETISRMDESFEAEIGSL